MNAEEIGFLISTILTGVAAIIGAIKGVSADRKVASQEVTVKSQGQSIEKALAYENRITSLEENVKIAHKNSLEIDKQERIMREHGERLIRFEERVLKLEQLPEKLDNIREAMNKSELERAKNDGIVNTKLDTLIHRIDEIQKNK